MKGANRTWGFEPAAAGRGEEKLCRKRHVMVLEQPRSCEAHVGQACTCFEQ